MLPGREREGGLIGGCGLIHPGVDDQAPIDPDSNAVVGGGGEGVGGCVEVKAARPAHREVVGANSVGGR